MQRRSVAIAVIAAAIVLFAGGIELLHVERPGERMAARAPLVPRSSADAVASAASKIPQGPQQADVAQASNGADARPAFATPPANSPAATAGTTAVDDPPTAASTPDVSRHAELVERPQVGTRAVPGVEPTSPQRPEPSPKAATPSFDIVRVEPNGDTLVAGRAAPNSTVALTDRDKTVAETRTDAAGNFVLTPPTLPSGDHALGLREGQGGRMVESQQSVVVSVPHSRSQQVVVALAEPNQPTRLLSAPPAGPAAPLSQNAAASPAAAAPLAIRSVELENGSGLFASGVAPPGTDVRLYLNNSRVADVIAAAAGAWTVTVRRGLTAGRYAVRADSLKPDQSVASRVEVPFEVPPATPERQTSAMAGPGVAAVAHSSEPLPPTKAPPDAAVTKEAVSQSASNDASRPAAGLNVAGGGNVVVDELQTELVARGDNLWRISRKRLGFGTRYTQIYAANVAQIRDPKLIYPGQVFVMPR